MNQAQKELFAQKRRAIDLIPPTQAALIQHVAYISGWLLLVTILHCSTRNSLSICLGVDQERHWKVRCFVENSFDVGAKKDVAGNVNVSKLHSSVLHYVFVQEIVTQNKYLCMTHLTQLR